MERKKSNFLQILNLPVRHGLEKFFVVDDNPHNNWYRYLTDLNLVSEAQYEQLRKGQGLVTDGRALDSYLLQIEKYFQIKEQERAETIVDLGCGWGFITLYLAQFRSKRIVAVAYPSQIAVLQKVITAAKSEGLFAEDTHLELRPEPLTSSTVFIGGVSQADKVIMSDVIEHMHSSLYSNLALAVYNTLKSGGLLISKSHNSVNAGVLRDHRHYWDKCEKEYLIKQRENLIRDRAPEFSDVEIEKLATSTRGYTRETLEGAIKLAKEKKLFPALNPNLVPVDIELDNYMLENFVQPGFWKNFLEQYGFSVETTPAALNSRRLRLFSPFVSRFPSLFMRLEPFSASVLIRARKP